MKRAALTLVFLISASGAAESFQDSWENLRRLAPGQQIRIVLNDAMSYVGQFQSASGAGIVVRLSDSDRTFERENVLRISAPAKSHRGRNALIGFGVGAGAGIAAGVAAPELGQGKCAQGSCVNAASAAVGGVLGAVIGAGLGAVIPTGRWQDVYRAR